MSNAHRYLSSVSGSSGVCLSCVFRAHMFLGPCVYRGLVFLVHVLVCVLDLPD